MSVAKNNKLEVHFYNVSHSSLHDRLQCGDYEAARIGRKTTISEEFEKELPSYIHMVSKFFEMTTFGLRPATS